MRVGNTFSDRIDGDGMTMAQIAAVLGISKDGVWKILNRAYRKLRRDPQAIQALRDAAALAQAARNRRHTWADDESEAA